MTGRDICDLAEAQLIARATADDQLRLLAAVAAGLGAEGLEDYLTPAERWAQDMGGTQDQPQLPAGAARFRQVLDFIETTQGEVG